MRRLSLLSIRTRTGLLAGAGTLLLLVLLCLGVYVMLGQSLQRQIDVNLRGRVPILLAEIGEDLGDYIEVESELIDEGAGAAQVVRTDGQVIAASGGLSQTDSVLPPAQLQRLVPGQVLPLTVGDGSARYRVVTAAFGDRATVLVVGQNLEAVRSAQRALIAVLLPLGLLAVVATGAVSMVVAGRALGPLTAMAKEAADIGAGNVSQRLSVPGSDDEVAQIATTINAMLARLERTIQRERTFAADASHELRTPLAILRGEIEMARTRTDDATAQRLDSALEETDRLGELVADLLLLARAGSDHYVAVPVDLAALASTTAERFSVLAATKNVRIGIHGAASVNSDRRYLERALSNLIDNALRHTPKDGTIEITCAMTSTGAVVVVADTGPGVPDDQLPDIFHRFTRVDEARTTGGAGIGLAIVAAVAAAHNGSVQARNRPQGPGLEIRLELNDAPQLESPR